MGLGYFVIFLTIIFGSVWAVLLLKAARTIWSDPRLKWFAIIPLVLGLLSAAAALFMLYIVWREPPWRFHF